jgi:hypothetical protein
MRRSRSGHNRAGRDVVEHKDAILPLAKACRYPALHRLLTRDLAIGSGRMEVVDQHDELFGTQTYGSRGEPACRSGHLIGLSR